MRTTIFLFALVLTSSASSLAQERGQSVQGGSDSHLIQTNTIDSTGDSALLKMRKGNSYFSQKDYAAAVEYYKIALDLRPDYHDAHYNLGVANLDWGRYEEAAKAFKQALTLDQRATTYELLGVVHQRLKQPQSAVEYYKKALRLNPASALSNNNIGYVYLGLKRHEAAAAFFGTALKLRPEFPEATQGLCTALAYLPATLEALESCTNAVETAPNSETYHYLVALIYFGLDHYREAIESFERAARLNPNNELTQNGIGHSYYRLGQHQKALSHFQRAIEIQPDLGDAHAGLGSVYYRLRKPKEATKALRQALKLNPESVEARFNLAIACLTIDQRDCAIEQYNRLKIEEPEVSQSLFRILFRNRVIDARNARSK